jgi:hypothetical protein
VSIIGKRGYKKYYGGSASCEHGRQKARYGRCGSTIYNEHMADIDILRVDGSAICEHGKRRSSVQKKKKECRQRDVAETEQRRGSYNECGGSGRLQLNDGKTKMSRRKKLTVLPFVLPWLHL